MEGHVIGEELSSNQVERRHQGFPVLPTLDGYADSAPGPGPGQGRRVPAALERGAGDLGASGIKGVRTDPAQVTPGPGTSGIIDKSSRREE